jgi:hypothetical protein
MFLAAKVGEAGPFSHALQCGIAKLITLANSCPIDLIIAAFWQAPSEARLSCSGDNSLISRGVEKIDCREWLLRYSAWSADTYAGSVLI